MNNAINEIKNPLERTNSRITEAEDRISEVKDRMVGKSHKQSIILYLKELEKEEQI